jgi:hypothetical protein
LPQCCGPNAGSEHTLIEPFAGDKADPDPFLKTLGSLENHPLLTVSGNMITVSQPVGAIPRGIKWTEVPVAILAQLAPVLPTLAQGRHTFTIRSAKWKLDLNISKTVTAQSDPGKFFTARVYPDDPGPELVLAAIEKKIPKLAATTADKKILLPSELLYGGNGSCLHDPEGFCFFVTRLVSVA